MDPTLTQLVQQIINLTLANQQLQNRVAELEAPPPEELDGSRRSE
jgi:hypothetical protein